MLSLKNCLVGARILLSMVEQVFLLMWKFWSMYNAETMHSEGREEAKCQRKFYGVFFFFLVLP